MEKPGRGQCWLVAGGAGYIGAHVVRSLQAAGANPVVLDDLSSGIRDRVDVPFVLGDIGDADLVYDTLRSHRVAGVIHLAADKQVEESVRQPLRYYGRNLISLMQLLSAMQRAEVDRLIFSSSAAVYGMVPAGRVREDDPTEPINPYGETKLIGEWLIRDQARATGLRFAALRYFNVVGAGAPELGDRGCSNLVPMIFDALRRGDRPRIFGSDYPTPDGTCVRDYIHVADLADAHVAAIAALGEPAAQLVVNVGCGRGYSVREVVDTVAEVVGVELDPVLADRRAGDPASVVADTSRIEQVLGWHARHDLADMVRSAWSAEQARVEQSADALSVAGR